MALPKTAKVTSVALLLAVAIGGALYLNRPESSAATQSTDDAYVRADFTTVAPQVSGTVKKVLIEDNQSVKAGDLLAIIDDRDFVVAVDTAKARVASAQASIASLQAHLVLQETAIRQAQAAVYGGRRLAQASQRKSGALSQPIRGWIGYRASATTGRSAVETSSWPAGKRIRRACRPPEASGHSQG